MRNAVNISNSISQVEYHPFGTTGYRSGRNELDVSLKRYKYVGKERDEETGLYYYGARYYAGWLGRWISTDPLKEKYLNFSPYCYCANNPMVYIDPDGKKIVPAGRKEVKHLNLMIKEIFGEKSGFKANRRGINFNKKDLIRIILKDINLN